MFQIHLSAARVNKKLTQKQLATLMKVSNSTINNWENGKSGPDYDMLVKLTQILEIPMDMLTIP